ncbi:MAG: glucosamine-6-phosphate deaminase [Kiritimatiellae bacterium]|jgi:glucosamine-6-phosphate deaminase|nr:glucosamine-6-phosphate deaminase [Kiritimatiellia bacterium]MBO7309354.1 glucosamine-6-phosphate deaminase [Kiritimatiellia bacterium]MBR2919970.1 glucosamine-6-phosphate deaminase [Kiritimatiellia bacterium]MBR3777718.1 glucosamine-6-phosphate deaminase [Kiritimatiellia bacterium]
MEIVICKTKKEASRKAADMIAKLVKENPKCVLGLATGSTPVEMYDCLAKDVKAKKISFKNVKSWNLDEYYGLAPTHDQSYRYFMNENFFDKIDIKKSNTHVLNGLAKDWRKECAAYEAQIKKAGGIDLQVLGIGSDGHIAFNEPGSSLASRTRIVYLTPQTIKDNARFFKKASDVPVSALSMGVGTICEAKKVVLLAFGKNKADAVKGMVEGGMSQFCTASALQAHNDAWVFCDEEAASKLKLKKFYAWRSEIEMKG